MADIEKGCDNCKHEQNSGIEYPCSVCIRNCTDKWEPVPATTNFDRIKAMSVEELAGFIGRIDHYTEDGECMVVLGNSHLNDYESDIIEWLRQEVEE